LKSLGEDGGAEQSPSDELLNLLALNQAALDAAQWEDALALAQRLIESSPEEPLPRLRLAQTLVARAEVQCLCRALEVQFHSPGEFALLDEARQAFEGAMQALLDNTNLDRAEQDPDSLDWSSDEVRHILALWHARGAAVFQPQPATAKALWEALKLAPVKPVSLAALIMALHRSGDDAGAEVAAQPDWHPEPIGGSVFGHPLVLVQLALVLTETNPEQALEVAADGGERASMSVSGGWPVPAMLHYLLAGLAFRNGAFGRALQAVEAALSDWPQEPRWHFLAAQICLAQDPEAGLPDPLKAQEHLERAVALEPDHAPHYLALGQVRGQAGQTRQAVVALERASILNPKSGQTWLALAQAQQALGDLDQAAVSAEQAIAQIDDPIPALLLSGKIALQIGQAQMALERAQAILKKQPDHAGALYLLAQALESLERPDEALVAMDRALPHFENPFSMQLERVHMLRRAKGLGAALTGLQELATRFDMRPEILALLSDWLEEAGDRQSAVQAAQMALQHDHGELPASKRAAAHYRIGMNARQTGHLDQAIHHLNQAIEFNASLLDAYLELGQAHQERREYQAALKVYQSAIAVAPGDFHPYFQAGLVLKDNKEYLAAEKMLRRASQLAPNDVGVHRLLGAVMALNLVHNRHMASPDA
jgi:tetratricopeptide (TPR) repeat protein